MICTVVSVACLGKGPIASQVGVVMMSLKRIRGLLSLLVNCTC